MSTTAQGVEDALNAIGKSLGAERASKVRGEGRVRYAPLREYPSPQIVRAAATGAEPEVLWDETSLRGHLDWFTSSARHFGIGVHFGLKANNSSCVLELLRNYVDGADAQSMGEVALAQRARFRLITATGPAFSSADSVALRAEGVRFDLDSEEQTPFGSLRSYPVGVRARFRLPAWLQNPRARPQHSRFGVPLTADGLLSWPAKGVEIERIRLHSSESQALDVASAFLLKVLWTGAIRTAIPGLREVNLGGGLLDLSRDKARFESALEALRIPMQIAEGVKFWIEPGAALLLDYAWLATDVLAVGDNCATIASSPWNLAPWLRPAAFIVRDGEAHPFGGELYGPSHYENDMLSVDSVQGATGLRPRVGDRVLLSSFGAYTLVHARRFGEFPLPSQSFVRADGTTEDVS